MTDLRKAAQQVLEALERANSTAMLQSVKARIPECGDFAGIAQDIDWAIATLRAALAQPDVPQGWVLVPVEPTHEMCDQGAQAIVQWENGCVWPDSWGNTYVKQYRKDAKKAYSAMLAAAPKGGT